MFFWTLSRAYIRIQALDNVRRQLSVVRLLSVVWRAVLAALNGRSIYCSCQLTVCMPESLDVVVVCEYVSVVLAAASALS